MLGPQIVSTLTMHHFRFFTTMFSLRIIFLGVLFGIGIAHPGTSEPFSQLPSGTGRYLNTERQYDAIMQGPAGPQTSNTFQYAAPGGGQQSGQMGQNYRPQGYSQQPQFSPAVTGLQANEVPIDSMNTNLLGNVANGNSRNLAPNNGLNTNNAGFRQVPPPNRQQYAPANIPQQQRLTQQGGQQYQYAPQYPVRSLSQQQPQVGQPYLPQKVNQYPARRHLQQQRRQYSMRQPNQQQFQRQQLPVQQQRQNTLPPQNRNQYPNRQYLPQKQQQRQYPSQYPNNRFQRQQFPNRNQLPARQYPQQGPPKYSSNQYPDRRFQGGQTLPVQQQQNRQNRLPQYSQQKPQTGNYMRPNNQAPAGQIQEVRLPGRLQRPVDPDQFPQPPPQYQPPNLEPQYQQPLTNDDPAAQYIKFPPNVFLEPAKQPHSVMPAFTDPNSIPDTIPNYNIDKLPAFSPIPQGHQQQRQQLTQGEPLHTVLTSQAEGQGNFEVPIDESMTWAQPSYQNNMNSP